MVDKRQEIIEKLRAKSSDDEEEEESSSIDGGAEGGVEDDAVVMDQLHKFFNQNFSIGVPCMCTQTPKVIDDLSFDGLLKHWREKGFKQIVTMVGAGISTSAGIPDFRSAGTGLYDNLQEFDLPHPTSIFDLEYFRENPKPFFTLAKELYPGSFRPTICHYFVRLLHEKGLLVRHYTQNIDTLERIAGIPDEKLVEAHGTFYNNHCVECGEHYDMEWMKTEIFADRLPTCTKCEGIVKPDIVFFGENLPQGFHVLPMADFKKCDLLIIMGTSLEVQPFASLVDRAGPNCMRLLINREKVGLHSTGRSWYRSDNTLLYDNPTKNKRDVAYLGNCDDGALALAEALGWGDELRELMESEHKRLAEEAAEEDAKKSPTSTTPTSEDKPQASEEKTKAD